VIDSTDILVGFAALGFLFAALALFQLRRHIARLQRDGERQANLLLALQGTLKVMSGEALSHRQELSNILRAIERLATLNQETRLEMRLRNADHSPYTQAIRLIRHGQSREAVRKLCALTETEVDLLFSLHAQGLAAEVAERDAPATMTDDS